MKFWFSLLLAATLSADEVVVEKKALFSEEESFEAAILPQEAQVLRLSALEWSDFTLLEFKAHGSLVKKDEVLWRCDERGITRRIADLGAEISRAKLDLAQAQQDLARMEKESPRELAELQQGLARSQDNLSYFEKLGRAQEEREVALALASAERRLEANEEELKQLLKMYEEDEVTEETEEIILKSQRAAVEMARLALQNTKERSERTLKTELPRRLEDLQKNLADWTKSAEEGEKNLARALEIKALEVASLERGLARSEESLANLQKDQALMAMKSPQDARLYHGEIADGQWRTDHVAKALEIGGKLPLQRGVMSLVATETPRELVARLSQEKALKMKVGMRGEARFAGLPGLSYEVTLKELEAVPDAAGQYQARLDGAWPERLPAGASAEVSLRLFEKKEVLVVPAGLITRSAEGAELVRVKLADGKDELRPIKTGVRTAKFVEVSAGLEAGQVILPPENAVGQDKEPAPKEKEAAEAPAETQKRDS